MTDYNADPSGNPEWPQWAIRELSIPGVWAVDLPAFPDERGTFVAPFVDPAHRTRFQRGLFPLQQVSYSRSRSGVVRGIHYTRTPPGCEKYVFCPAGSLIDYVVDLRRDSATYGQWDSLTLNGGDGQALYLPNGIGHAFASLSDDATVTYLLSRAYVPADELAVSVFDPQIGLHLPPLPDGLADYVMSERDREAPTLSGAEAEGLLPAAFSSEEQP